MKTRLFYQIELQRRKECWRYPSSCMVKMLLEDSGLLDKEVINILDLTYGRGIFYHVLRDKVRVYGFDIRKLDWVVEPYRFYKKSAVNWRKHLDDYGEIDLVVVDPPWGGNHKLREHFKARDMVLLLREGERASRHFNVPLLVHFAYRVVPYKFRVKLDYWWIIRVRYLNLSNFSPSWWGLLYPDEG